MPPEWTHNWTIYEVARILLYDCPEYSIELPDAPASQRLNTVWSNLTPDCRCMLQLRHDNF